MSIHREYTLEPDTWSRLNQRYSSYRRDRNAANAGHSTYVSKQSVSREGNERLSYYGNLKDAHDYQTYLIDRFTTPNNRALMSPSSSRSNSSSSSPKKYHSEVDSSSARTSDPKPQSPRFEVRVLPKEKLSRFSRSPSVSSSSRAPYEYNWGWIPDSVRSFRIDPPDDERRYSYRDDMSHRTLRRDQ